MASMSFDTTARASCMNRSSVTQAGDPDLSVTAYAGDEMTAARADRIISLRIVDSFRESVEEPQERSHYRGYGIFVLRPRLNGAKRAAGFAVHLGLPAVAVGLSPEQVLADRGEFFRGHYDAERSNTGQA